MKNINQLAQHFFQKLSIDGRYSIIDDVEEPETENYTLLPDSALQEFTSTLPTTERVPRQRRLPPPLPRRSEEAIERAPLTQRSPMDSELMGSVTVNGLMREIRSLLMDIEDENRSGNYIVAKDLSKKLISLSGDMYDHFRVKSK